MPPKFDFAHTTQLDTIELLTSRPSRIDFDAGDGLHLVVEAHAPGVFRLRFGEASLLNDDKPGARAPSRKCCSRARRPWASPRSVRATTATAGVSRKET